MRSSFGPIPVAGLLIRSRKQRKLSAARMVPLLVTLSRSPSCSLGAGASGRYTDAQCSSCQGTPVAAWVPQVWERERAHTCCRSIAAVKQLACQLKRQTRQAARCAFLVRFPTFPSSLVPFSLRLSSCAISADRMAGDEALHDLMDRGSLVLRDHVPCSLDGGKGDQTVRRLLEEAADLATQVPVLVGTRDRESEVLHEPLAS